MPVMTDKPRRFTAPWDIEDNGACFIVRDHNGQALSSVYYEQESGSRKAANLLTRDEARRIAINIAKLPGVAEEAAGRLRSANPTKRGLSSKMPR
jgi:hypothetical protein